MSSGNQILADQRVLLRELSAIEADVARLEEQYGPWRSLWMSVVDATPC
jgi:hypothetical protein